MKIKEGFILRKVADTSVVVAVGKAAESFKGMISLNESATFLWNKLESGVEDIKELTDALMEEYGIDNELASRDVNAFVEKVKDAGCFED